MATLREVCMGHRDQGVVLRACMRCNEPRCGPAEAICDACRGELPNLVECPGCKRATCKPRQLVCTRCLKKLPERLRRKVELGALRKNRPSKALESALNYLFNLRPRYPSIRNLRKH